MVAFEISIGGGAALGGVAALRVVWSIIASMLTMALTPSRVEGPGNFIEARD
jgi:hypothetical protein